MEARLPYGPWPLEVGKTYEIRFPFKLGEYHPYPDWEDPAAGGTQAMPVARETWVPGWDEHENYYGTVHICDGWGAELRSVVSVHKPGRYPERVFYVRQWRDPNGRVFGKARLRVLASRDFRAWARGDRYRRAFSGMRVNSSEAA